MKKNKVVKKAETKPTCPFYVKKGIRCVLLPRLRRYPVCGAVPCTVDRAVSVDVSRPDDR